MDLKPDIQIDDGKESYYLRLSELEVARTVTLNDAVFYVFNNSRVSRFEVVNTDSTLSAELARLAERFENVVYDGKTLSVSLFDSEPVKKYDSGIVIIDLDGKNRLVGIEIA